MVEIQAVDHSKLFTSFYFIYSITCWKNRKKVEWNECLKSIFVSCSDESTIFLWSTPFSHHFIELNISRYLLCTEIFDTKNSTHTNTFNLITLQTFCCPHFMKIHSNGANGCTWFSTLFIESVLNVEGKNGIKAQRLNR